MQISLLPPRPYFSERTVPRVPAFADSSARFRRIFISRAKEKARQRDTPLSFSRSGGRRRGEKKIFPLEGKSRLRRKGWDLSLSLQKRSCGIATISLTLSTIRPIEYAAVVTNLVLLMFFFFYLPAILFLSGLSLSFSLSLWYPFFFLFYYVESSSGWKIFLMPRYVRLFFFSFIFSLFSEEIYRKKSS